MQLIARGLERFRIEKWLGIEPYLRARIELLPDVVESGIELDALQHSLRCLAQEVVALSPNLPEEASTFLEFVEDPRYLAYLVAGHARANGQRWLLCCPDMRQRVQLPP